MKRSHRRPDKPVRRALDRWYIPVLITLVYAASAPGAAPATRATVTTALVVAYILGGIGQVVCIWSQRLSQLRWQPAADDDHRLRVLTGQATITVFIGTLANQFWGATVVGLPVVVSLVAVVTLRDAVESVFLADKVRTAYYEQLRKQPSARHGG